MKTVEQQPFGHFLLALSPSGSAATPSWRLVPGGARARPRRGRQRHRAARGARERDRLRGICAVAVKLLTSSGSSGSSGNAKKTASGVFAWPAGRWLVLIAGLVMIGVGVYQLVRGVTKKFLDDAKTERMGRADEDLDHLGRHGRPRRPRGRLRPGRRLPRQGRRSTTRPTRRSASTARSRSSTTRRTARGSSAPSRRGWSRSGSSRSPRRATGGSSLRSPCRAAEARACRRARAPGRGSRSSS